MPLVLYVHLLLTAHLFPTGLTQSQSIGQLNKKAFAFAPFSTQDSFMSGSNAVYVDQMYSSWKKNPDRLGTTHECEQN